MEELEKIQNKADAAGLDVVVYISMAFGNPYGDPWSIDEVIDAIALLEVDNLHMISLADTVGMAVPQQISDLVGAVMAIYDYLEIGVHPCTAVPSTPPKRFLRPTTPAAAALIPLWAASAAVPSPRTRW